MFNFAKPIIIYQQEKGKNIQNKTTYCDLSKLYKMLKSKSDNMVYTAVFSYLCIGAVFLRLIYPLRGMDDTAPVKNDRADFKIFAIVLKYIQKNIAFPQLL